MNERCDKCKFWDRLGDENERAKNLHDDDRSGKCKRYPPVLDATWPTEAGEGEAGYSYLDWRHWNQPVTEASNFCGEFKKKAPR